MCGGSQDSAPSPCRVTAAWWRSQRSAGFIIATSVAPPNCDDTGRLDFRRRASVSMSPLTPYIFADVANPRAVGLI